MNINALVSQIKVKANKAIKSEYTHAQKATLAAAGAVACIGVVAGPLVAAGAVVCTVYVARANAK